MKVLWITNSPFPEVFKELKRQAPVTVGWVNSAAKELLHIYPSMEMCVASFFNSGFLKEYDIEGIKHFLIPNTLRNKPESEQLGDFWKQINDKFQPDVVHIHGTEYPHSYSFVKFCDPDNVVISIQGLISVYERYYYGSIDYFKLLKSVTIRDILRFDTIFRQRRNMKKRAIFEKRLVKMAHHIIGRTDWDKDHVWALNPDVKYHFCNETLRSSFYNKKWSLDKCEKYSIFVSQGHYPIKGLHQLIKALPIVLSHFPDTKVYVAGNNFFSNKGMRINGFGNYINKLITREGLGNKIIFTGLLNEIEMCNRFINSHVFVCPSAIENSPNSVGESQLLGVPCISANIGGVSNMVSDKETGYLYRFEEVEMLASKVCNIFSNNKFAKEVSEKGIIVAKQRHNRRINAEKLYQIYSDIKSMS